MRPLLGVDGETACGTACAGALHGDGAASLIASLVLSGTNGAGQAAENINGQLGSSSAVQVQLTPQDSNGRFTFTLNAGAQPLDQPTHYVGYVVDSSHAVVLSTDPHAMYLLLSGSFSHD